MNFYMKIEKLYFSNKVKSANTPISNLHKNATFLLSHFRQLCKQTCISKGSVTTFISSR